MKDEQIRRVRRADRPWRAAQRVVHAIGDYVRARRCWPVASSSMHFMETATLDRWAGKGLTSIPTCGAKNIWRSATAISRETVGHLAEGLEPTALVASPRRAQGVKSSSERDAGLRGARPNAEEFVYA